MFHELVSTVFFVLFPLFGVAILLYFLWQAYLELREQARS